MTVTTPKTAPLFDVAITKGKKQSFFTEQTVKYRFMMRKGQ